MLSCESVAGPAPAAATAPYRPPSPAADTRQQLRKIRLLREKNRGGGPRRNGGSPRVDARGSTPPIGAKAAADAAMAQIRAERNIAGEG